MTEEQTAAIDEARGELSLARVALAEDDLHHAANHVGGAIGYAPELPEIHELLAALAARSPDGGLGLFPLADQAYIGGVVAHAHLLARTDPANALMMLARATAFDPSKRWADAAWVQALAARTVDPDTLARVFVTVMRDLDDPAEPPVREANAVYLDLAGRALEAHPEHAFLHGAAAGLCRRLGDTALAVRWGRRAVQLDPQKLTRVWYAYALKADGQLEEALLVMAEARRENPLDLDVSADMASWLTDAGRLDEALALIEEAMRIDPTYDCAVHTAHRLRYLRDGDAQHLVELADFIRANPVPSHEHSDLADCCRDEPWLGEVTGPTEACLNVLAQVAPENRAGLGNLSLSALEVPSALAVLRRECPGIQVEIAGPPPADMVTVLRPGRALWRYDGMTAHPTVEPPSRRAAELLNQIARPWWPDPVAAFDQALPLGQLPVEELLSLLVHPPACPEMFEAADGWWERTAQVFACLGILHCQELSSGTPGDTAAPRRLLTEIAYGVEDWTTEAALFALTVAAWTDPTCRDEVRDTVGRRFVDAVNATQHRAVTILPSLAELVRIVPGMVPEVVALAQDVAGADDDEDEDKE